MVEISGMVARTLWMVELSMLECGHHDVGMQDQGMTFNLAGWGGLLTPTSQQPVGLAAHTMQLHTPRLTQHSLGLAQLDEGRGPYSSRRGWCSCGVWVDALTAALSGWVRLLTLCACLLLSLHTKSQAHSNLTTPVNPSVSITQSPRPSS